MKVVVFVTEEWERRILDTTMENIGAFAAGDPKNVIHEKRGKVGA